MFWDGVKFKPGGGERRDARGVRWGMVNPSSGLASSEEMNCFPFIDGSG